MRWMQSTLVIGFAALLFIGNVGVNVFHHHCESNGDAVFFVFNESEDHCESHTNEKPSCCQHDSEHDQEEESEDDCCDQEVEYFKLDSDYSMVSIDDDQIDYLAVLSTRPIAVPDFKKEQDLYTTRYVNPPPPDGRQILLEKQVWLI